MQQELPLLRGRGDQGQEAAAQGASRKARGASVSDATEVKHRGAGMSLGSQRTGKVPRARAGGVCVCGGVTSGHRIGPWDFIRRGSQIAAG